MLTLAYRAVPVRFLFSLPTIKFTLKLHYNKKRCREYEITCVTCKECACESEGLCISSPIQNQLYKPIVSGQDIESVKLFCKEVHIQEQLHNTWFALRPRPIKKLSGLISRWRKPLVCIYSTLLIWNQTRCFSVMDKRKNCECITHKLISKHENGFQREFSVAVVEQVFKTWT